MKKISLFILSLFLICGLCNEAFSESQGSSAGEFIKVGGAGSQFLKIGIGARACGMGGAYASLANDLTSIYWNPAGLADVKSYAANFSYTQWFANFNHNFAAAAMPLGENFTAAIHFTSFGCSNMELTTMMHPEGAGTFSVNDMALGATFSGYLTDQFSFGITANYLRNGISDMSSSGVSFDIGTMYKTGIQGIVFGFSVQNLGTEMKYAGSDLSSTQKIMQALNAAPNDVEFLSSSYSVPLTFRAGISSELYNDEKHRVIAALDFLTLSDTPEQFILGAEYTYDNLVSFRAGYNTGHDQLGFSAGIGINYISGGFTGQIDYSISPTKELGLVNRISVGIDIK